MVIITSPTGLHAEMTLAAADAGKHVLVEKPLEATVEAGERMVERCRERGVRLGVIFQMRFGRVADMLRELLGSGGTRRDLAGPTPSTRRAGPRPTTGGRPGAAPRRSRAAAA